MQLCTNVGTINDLIDAQVSERTRLMGRSVKASQAYNLRGDKHASGMIDHLNNTMQNTAVRFKRCIITNVVLSQEVATTMQDTTIKQFEKTLSKK